MDNPIKTVLDLEIAIQIELLERCIDEINNQLRLDLKCIGHWYRSDIHILKVKYGFPTI